MLEDLVAASGIECIVIKRQQIIFDLKEALAGKEKVRLWQTINAYGFLLNVEQSMDQ